MAKIQDVAVSAENHTKLSDQFADAGFSAYMAERAEILQAIKEEESLTVGNAFFKAKEAVAKNATPTMDVEIGLRQIKCSTLCLYELINACGNEQPLELSGLGREGLAYLLGSLCDKADECYRAVTEAE